MGCVMSFYKDRLNYDGFRRNCIETELKFILIPKRCYISKKLLWLTLAYKQTAMWTGPDLPVFEDRWYDKTEFLIEKIKGTL